MYPRDHRDISKYHKYNLDITDMSWYLRYILISKIYHDI